MPPVIHTPDDGTPLIKQTQSSDNHSTTTDMSSSVPPVTVNGDSSSKAPEQGTGGFQTQTKMTVIPPKKEDLQRSYATIVENDANPKGWYGTMSTSFAFPRCGLSSPMQLQLQLQSNIHIR